MYLGFEIQKTNVGIRISILETPCVSIFKQKNSFDFSNQNLPKNGFGVEIQKNNFGIRISILRLLCISIFK